MKRALVGTLVTPLLLKLNLMMILSLHFIRQGYALISKGLPG